MIGFQATRSGASRSKSMISFRCWMRLRAGWSYVLRVVALVLAVTGAVAWGENVMKVGAIVEERMIDDELAVVVPERLELEGRMGTSPWGFCFPGFETNWPARNGPIELEVTGSPDFATMDMNSIAAIGLDFGGKENAWLERSLWGLGSIQPARPPHPPSWGVGNGAGKTTVRGALVKQADLAGGKPVRVKLDPAKFAPKGWDGRLWVGLYLHNVGAGKFLKVRIVNGGASDVPELDEQAKWQLIEKHQKTFLQRALKDLEQRENEKGPTETVTPEMKPYANTISRPAASTVQALQLRQLLNDYDKSPAGAMSFLNFAEAYFTADLTRGQGEDRAAELNRFFNTWKNGGEVGKEMGCIIRIASGAEKVYLNDVKSGRVVTSAKEPIRLSAAKHEYEGFQVVLSPLEGASEDVKVSVSKLRNEAGAVLDPAKINPVGYVRIFEKQPREALVPDPLLVGEIPKLTAGENQPVWVTVHVPIDSKAGMYRGQVTVASGEKHVEIPLEVRVREFAIPKQISLRSSFWMFREQMNRFYHVKEVNEDDYLKWIDMALEHRLNPIDVYEGSCEQLVDVIKKSKASTKPEGDLSGVPNENPDFTKWDRYVERMVAGGANTIHLGQTHHQGSMFVNDPKEISTPKQVENVVKAAKILEDHYSKKGWMEMHYLQLRDETSAPDSLNVYRAVKKQMPELKLLLTAPSKEAKPLLDIPCPLTPGFDAKWRDEAHKNGDEYWWYVCIAPRDPAWANFFIEQEAPQHRALFWQTWSHDVDGLLHWGLNFWSWYQYQWPAGIKGPTKRVPAPGEPNYASLPECPGDGFSMYPGKTPGDPLSSVRLEVMRDGEEDYEYLKILDGLIAKSPADSAEVKKAQALREEIKTTFAILTKYPLEPDAYLNLRERIADEIEALSK
jgi:hypothetical protein